ncbi:hypothetical protein [Nonomuraea jabiensis]|uniref:LacI family transcriptional regulator n=1 Tax=Nonomuraea jabiensis TaxID=882448 RepID=A0A7W9GH93_9ACTN|nr:hypothetical protein [Nonomuraea jabiensis]MBB5783765.1 hypothetical protein [Nonomuraea jabiensis]
MVAQRELTLAHAVEKAARSRGYALHVTTDAPEPGKLLERFRELTAPRSTEWSSCRGARSVDASGLDLVGLPRVQLNTTNPLPGETEYSWPALSSVRQPIEAVAEASVDRLLDQHSAERRHETFFGTLIPRASCGPHPVRSPR